MQEGENGTINHPPDFKKPLKKKLGNPKVNCKLAIVMELKTQFDIAIAGGHSI